MKLIDIYENVVKFENSEMKAKRLKHQKQLKDLKAIDHKGNQKKLDIMVNRSKIKAIK